MNNGTIVPARAIESKQIFKKNHTGLPATLEKK